MQHVLVQVMCWLHGHMALLVMSWHALISRPSQVNHSTSLLAATLAGLMQHYGIWSDASPAALLQGPKDTPFEAGRFELVMNVPEQYPLVPPAVRFKTKIFHPNVHFKVRWEHAAARSDYGIARSQVIPRRSCLLGAVAAS